jgi:hypothetical protein
LNLLRLLLRLLMQRGW